MEMAWSRDDLEEDEPLGRRRNDDLPGFKATEPLQKEKQIKNQMNQKKKKRAKIQAITTLTPLKKSRPWDLVAQGTSMTWGHRFQLGYPFPLFIVPPRISDDQLPLLWGGLLHLSPKSDRSFLIYQFLFTNVDSLYLWWYPMDLSINFLLFMKTFLLLSWDCFK